MPSAPERHRSSGRAHEVPAERCVQPELLDMLPQDAAESRASRRDLRTINRLLRSRTWFARVLRARRLPEEGILEIGAGAGDLAQSLDAANAPLAGLDRIRRPPDWPAHALWFQIDVLQFTGWAGFPVVVANLFFHHFDRSELAILGRQLDRHVRLIVASEPLRTQRTRRLFRLVCSLIRAHAVTRHDGHASIVAGFRGAELPGLLGLDPKRWRWEIGETWTGASRLIAERRG